jgi:hypothetical protein
MIDVVVSGQNPDATLGALLCQQAAPMGFDDAVRF